MIGKAVRDLASIGTRDSLAYHINLKSHYRPKRETADNMFRDSFSN